MTNEISYRRYIYVTIDVTYRFPQFRVLFEHLLGEVLVDHGGLDGQSTSERASERESERASERESEKERSSTEEREELS